MYLFHFDYHIGSIKEGKGKSVRALKQYGASCRHAYNRPSSDDRFLPPSRNLGRKITYQQGDEIDYQLYYNETFNIVAS